MLAQVATPPLVTPPIAPVAPPAATTPIVPAYAPSQPVVQQTPSVEERRAASMAAAQAEAATQAAERPAARPRAVERTIAPVTAVAVPVAAAQVTPASVAPAQPVVPQRVASPTPASEPAPRSVNPAPVNQVVKGTDDALLWAMGGTALLLLGLGGAALARRRRPVDAVEASAVLAQTATVATPVARPALAPMVAPAARQPMGHANATLAAMVAAPPGADNPFLTRSKRLRRARVLLAERQSGAAPVPTQAQGQSQAQTQRFVSPTIATDRSQTVYRFGGEGSRAGLLRPRTR